MSYNLLSLINAKCFSTAETDGVVPEMFTQEFQVRYLKAMNSVLDMFDFVAGEHPWNFADFDTQQGPMRAGCNHKGLFRQERTPKMAAYYIKNRWKFR